MNCKGALERHSSGQQSIVAGSTQMVSSVGGLSGCGHSAQLKRTSPSMRAFLDIKEDVKGQTSQNFALWTISKVAAHVLTMQILDLSPILTRSDCSEVMAPTIPQQQQT